MNKKLLILATIFLSISIIGIIILNHNQNIESNKTTNVSQIIQTNNIILYYGNGCPHCAIVEDYIKDNEIEKEIFFEQKEVYYNKQNSNELAEKAKACGILTDSIGVPFLWDSGKCFVGDQPIITFLKIKLNKK